MPNIKVSNYPYTWIEFGTEQVTVTGLLDRLYAANHCIKSMEEELKVADATIEGVVRQRDKAEGEVERLQAELQEAKNLIEAQAKFIKDLDKEANEYAGELQAFHDKEDENKKNYAAMMDRLENLTSGLPKNVHKTSDHLDPGGYCGCGEDKQPTENVCEHGDHPAPEGKRFCSEKCRECEMESVDGCDGNCGLVEPRGEETQSLEERLLYLEDTVEFNDGVYDRRFQELNDKIKKLENKGTVYGPRSPQRTFGSKP